MRTDNDNLNSLATHLLLDPEIQAKLFRVLAQGLRDGFVRIPQPGGGAIFDREPVEEFRKAFKFEMELSRDFMTNNNICRIQLIQP